MSGNSYCIFETATYVGMMQLVDHILKSANLEALWCRKIGGGMLTACFSGELGASMIAVDNARIFCKRQKFDCRTYLLSRPDPVIKQFLDR